ISASAQRHLPEEEGRQKNERPAKQQLSSPNRQQRATKPAPIKPVPAPVVEESQWDRSMTTGAMAAGKGDYDEAISDYTRAIEIDSKNALPYRDRGIMKTNKGDYDGAIVDLERAIELNPKGAAEYKN